MKSALSDDLTNAALAGLVEAVRTVANINGADVRTESVCETLDRVEATILKAAELRGHRRRQGEGFRDFMARTAK